MLPPSSTFGQLEGALNRLEKMWAGWPTATVSAHDALVLLALVFIALIAIAVALMTR
jgi:hypothetical protein